MIKLPDRTWLPGVIVSFKHDDITFPVFIDGVVFDPENPATPLSYIVTPIPDLATGAPIGRDWLRAQGYDYQSFCAPEGRLSPTN